MPVGMMMPVCSLCLHVAFFSSPLGVFVQRRSTRFYLTLPRVCVCAWCPPPSARSRRFVGLTRASRIEDQVHAERLLTREKNTLEAVKILTGGIGINYIPMVSVTPVDGVFPPPCFVGARRYASIRFEDRDNRWKYGDTCMPAALAPSAARVSAMVHLAACVKLARQNNPGQNARWALECVCVC